MESIIKRRLAEDKIVRVFGTGRMFHPALVEVLALHGGYDALWLDQEHCGLTTREIELATLSARAHGMDSFVRMAPTDYATVTRAMEAGAGGVMAARIFNEAEAEQFVQWAKFHPRGSRGMNNGGFDGEYSRLGLAEFAERANQNSFVSIQIETAEAVEDAAAIAAIDGVDLLFVGPSDLSQALGVTGQVNHPKCLEAIAHVAGVCKKHGKHWGTIAINPEYTDQRVAEGCRMLVIGADVKIAHAGIEATKKAFAKYFD
jgi:2-dehydro-3-deoxyglucarate aldolase/4-hydroxy-2-oxoheptanedioate aldolase